jgi:hypothetical protein
MSDDWLRHELEALEASAPLDDRSVRRTHTRAPLLAVAGGLAAVALVAVIALPSLLNRTALEGTPSSLPSESAWQSPSATATVIEPTPTAPVSTATPEPTPVPPISGVTWDSGNLEPRRGFVHKVIVEGDRFFAVGGHDHDPVIWDSSDGEHWHRHELPWQERFDQFVDAEPTDIPNRLSVDHLGSIDGQYIAIGHFHGCCGDYVEPAVWTSPDGQSWSAVDDTSLQRAFLVRDITAGPRGLLLVSTYFGEGEASAWLSADGAEWTEVDPVAESADLRVAVGTASTYFVAGNLGTTPVTSPAIWRSVDGRHWELLHIEDADRSGRIDALSVDGNGTWTALGIVDDKPAAWVSRDGHTWERSDGFGAEMELSAWEPAIRLASTGIGFVAVHQPLSEVGPVETWLSADGAVWSSFDSTEPPVANGVGTLQGGIAIVGDRIVVVGANNVPSDDNPFSGESLGWFSWTGLIDRAGQ